MSESTRRLLAVLALLRENGRSTGAQLATSLGVDGRTLRRYIARLEELGVPLTAERGRHGAYQLVDGYRLPSNLLVAESSTPGMRLERQRSDSAASIRALTALSRAAAASRRVRLRYRSRNDAMTERDFDIYGLTSRAGCDYAIGWCHLRRGIRSFRLDRIEPVEGIRLLGSRFERPRDFDALAHLHHSLATIPRAHSCRVWLDTDLERARGELFDALGVFEPLGTGVRLTSQVGGLAWLAQRLAGVSFPFRIERPAALRTAVRRHAQNLLRYAGARAPIRSGAR